MSTWQLQDAKARFSELVDTAERKGPQIITRRGVDTAVLVPIAEWKRLEEGKRLEEWKRLTPPTPPEMPTQKMTNAELLKFLQSAPDFEIPDRHAERLKKRARR